MLYISRWKMLAIIATTLLDLRFRDPEFLPEGRRGVVAEMGAAPYRAGPRPAGRLAHPARSGFGRVRKEKIEIAAQTTRSAWCARTSSAARSAVTVRGNTVEVRRSRGCRSAARVSEAPGIVAAARRSVAGDRAAHRRCVGCRQRAVPPDRDRAGVGRAHPAVGRPVDPDHRAARQRDSARSSPRSRARASTACWCRCRACRIRSA